jgi:predicted HTH transcriptional regulator
MSLPALPDFTKLSSTPLPECDWLEYKESKNAIFPQKLRETACAFLNTRGGYIVVGINDERNIVGIPLNDVDTCLRRVDDIYHEKSVLNEDGTPLPVGVLKAKAIELSSAKYLILYTITPEEGKTYILNDSSKFYRLAASNYRHTLENQFFTAADLQFIIDKRIKSQRANMTKIQQDYHTLLTLSKEQNIALGKLTRETQMLQSALHQAILNHKKMVEEDEEYQPLTFFQRLTRLFSC